MFSIQVVFLLLLPCSHNITKCFLNLSKYNKSYVSWEPYRVIKNQVIIFHNHNIFIYSNVCISMLEFRPFVIEETLYINKVLPFYSNFCHMACTHWWDLLKSNVETTFKRPLWQSDNMEMTILFLECLGHSVEHYLIENNDMSYFHYEKTMPPMTLRFLR